MAFGNTTTYERTPTRPSSNTVAEMFKRAELDAVQADRVERRWLEGDRITLDNILEGTGCILRVTAKQWWDWTNSRRDDDKPANPQRNASGDLMMAFGMHKGRKAIDIKNGYPDYWRWVTTEVSWFAVKAKEAGLL